MAGVFLVFSTKRLVRDAIWGKTIKTTVDEALYYGVLACPGPKLFGLDQMRISFWSTTQVDFKVH